MRGLFAFLGVVIVGCSPPPAPPVDAGPKDAGPDASVDAGADAGTDAGPVCTTEVCDGVDNDCDGLVDEAPDGGTFVALCPLQLGTCSGAQTFCSGGAYLPCTAAQYGAKYEEFESLCDGVDNDCSGVVDVSQWKPIGAAGTATTAVSVPGAWYVSTGLNGQMFDETLTPITDPYAVGRAGFAAAGAIWFGDTLHAQFQTSLGPAYLRRLNLDGTLVTGPGAEVALPFAGPLRTSNDRSTLFVGDTLALFLDGGIRAQTGDGGVRPLSPVGADELVRAVLAPSAIQLQLLSGDLAPLGPTAVLPVPGATGLCAISANTLSRDAGVESFVVACPDPGATLYATDAPFSGGVLTPAFVADAGISLVRALPSYAKATVFWVAGHSVWMGQVNGLPPVELAVLEREPTTLEIAPSVRGGYLLQTIFDGGQGVRPYGAYACPP